MSMKITQLFVHPVKSLQGVELQEAEVNAHGFVNDRVFMIGLPLENNRYQKLTQREFNSMALVHCYLVNGYLILKHNHYDVQLRLPLGAHMAEIAARSPRGKADIWGDDAGVYDIGEITGFKQFWNTIFDKYPDATLLAPIHDERRDVTEHFLDHHLAEFDRSVHSSFQDCFPGHLIATASLEELNERVSKETSGQSVPVKPRNFRPNMVVETSEPYEEDFWDTFKVGPVTWFTSSLCGRCPIPMINPETAESSKFRQPNKAMNRYRKLEPRFPGSPAFGISISNKETTGKIRVGDSVEVLETLARY